MSAICVFFVCIFLFAILSVGKMYRFSLFAHWLCIVYKYKKLWSAIHSMCIKSPCNTFQGILSHMKKPDSREVATRARMEDFFTVAFYIISLKKNQTWSVLNPAGPYVFLRFYVIKLNFSTFNQKYASNVSFVHGNI